jgi:serine/threonine-protein kinase
MGAVWLSRVRGAMGFEKFFAVKVPLPQHATDPSFRAMFIDEARIIAQIRHGNVVGVEHLGEHHGVPYLVLEWVQGGAWAGLIQACHRAQTVPADVMLRIAAGACAGLHAAHELRGEAGEPLQVVHRDVSPQNVLVSETGLTKVIDFGIAKARGRMADKTKAGMVKAKLEFASPEQLTGGEVDRRADIWGLGVTLYYIFAGRLPFDSENPAHLIASIGRGLTQPIPPYVPRSIADLVHRSLRVDPRERFETLASMKSAIEACITSPTSPETVAACLKEFLPGPLATRRQEIRLAVEEANRRAAVDRPDLDRAPPARVMMPTLPPELTQREWDGTAPPATEIPYTATHATAPARMGPLAWTLLVASTLLVLGIWTRVGMLAVEMRGGGRARTTEPRTW